MNFPQCARVFLCETVWGWSQTAISRQPSAVRKSF